MTFGCSSPAGFLAVLSLVLLGSPGAARDASLGQFDPSDMYFQAWLTLRDAKEAAEREQFLEAFEKYDRAKQLFDNVALYHPGWKPDLVRVRQESTLAAMEKIRAKAFAERRREEAKVEDLVNVPEQAARPAKPLEVPRIAPEQRAEVAELQKRIQEYRTQLERARNHRDLNAARLKRALEELEQRRNEMARAPVANRMQELETRIEKLERERDAMAVALRESRAEHQRALADLEKLQSDTEAAKQRARELQKLLDVQQKSANQVVAGLRRQIRELRESHKEKDKLLAAANVRAEQLTRQLEEAREQITDLREDRDSLLKERDQMAALLRINESERVQRLIEQNMQLGRALKHARDRVQQIFSDNSHTKDELNVAKRDLAVAKARIIELRRENESQKQRLAGLEEQLRDASREIRENLANEGLSPPARREMEMLRDLIGRQLRVQERRRQARDILVDEVRRLGIRDEAFDEAFQLFAQHELKLTPEEGELIKDFKVDDEFIFSDRPSPEELARSEQILQRNVGVKQELARRAYSNRRYLACREVYTSILDEHPGHVPTLLNLGIVHLRLDEPERAIGFFKDALLIRGPLPYAHFMLGVSHYRLEDYNEARSNLLRAVDLDPRNASAHVFLGNVCARNDQPGQAERHWREAIRIDSTLTEPFFNLALLEANRKNNSEAWKLYRTARRNGAEPDLGFEQRIAP